jgi:hypothetical protein
MGAHIIAGDVSPLTNEDKAGCAVFGGVGIQTSPSCRSGTQSGKAPWLDGAVLWGVRPFGDEAEAVRITKCAYSPIA